MSIKSQTYSANSGLDQPSAYYAVVAGHRLGPCTIAELARYSIYGDTWIWYEGLPGWTRADAVQQLRLILVAAVVDNAKGSTLTTEEAASRSSDFRRAMPFVAGVLIFFWFTPPLIDLVATVGVRDALVVAMIKEAPIRLSGFGAAFFLARALRLPLPWAWALPTLIRPAIVLVATIVLGVAARIRLRTLNIPMGLLGPKSNDSRH